MSQFPDYLSHWFQNEIIDFCSNQVFCRTVHDQHAGMMYLVADLRELRKPQDPACVTRGLEKKSAACYLRSHSAERGKRKEGAGRKSVWAAAAHCLALLLL